MNSKTPAPKRSTTTATTSSAAPRRGFLIGFFAFIIGGIAVLLPLVPGSLVFLNPILAKKKRKADPAAGSAGELEGAFKVGRLETLPSDGTPMYVKVINDRTDAWTYLPQRPIGAVFLRRNPDDSVTAFNVICPHAGCAVDFNPSSHSFICPCHNSSFDAEGKRGETSPSARDMDKLTAVVRDGDVWVKFQNFRTGTAEQIVLS